MTTRRIFAPPASARARAFLPVGGLAGCAALALLLSGCGGSPETLDLKGSCELLTNDQFQPKGTAQEQADQIAAHYEEIAAKVDPAIAGFIGEMAGTMEDVAASTDAVKTPEQLQFLQGKLDQIGTACG